MWFDRDDDEIDASGNVTPPLQEDLDIDGADLYKSSFPKSFADKGMVFNARAN